MKEAALTDPPLTTVASDRQAMARAAVDLVLDDGLRVAGSRRERLQAVPVAAGGPALLRLRWLSEPRTRR